MFLIRATFWICVAVLLLPADERQQGQQIDCAQEGDRADDHQTRARTPRPEAGVASTLPRHAVRYVFCTIHFA